MKQIESFTGTGNLIDASEVPGSAGHMTPYCGPVASDAGTNKTGDVFVSRSSGAAQPRAAPRTNSNPTRLRREQNPRPNSRRVRVAELATKPSREEFRGAAAPERTFDAGDLAIGSAAAGGRSGVSVQATAGWW